MGVRVFEADHAIGRDCAFWLQPLTTPQKFGESAIFRCLRPKYLLLNATVGSLFFSWSGS